MIDTISNLVRNVTIIILIACFLEMLLPQGEIKKFVKTVLGLFILISILNPILGLFDKNVVSEVLAWQDPIQEDIELNTILNQGESISKEMNEKAIEMYRINLAKQIETVVKLVKGVTWVEAEVEMEINNTNLNHESIEKVQLLVGTGENEKKKEGVKEIKPIEIDINGPQEKPKKNIFKLGDEEIKEQIIETLKNFYSFREEQLEVIMIEEHEEGKKNE